MKLLALAAALTLSGAAVAQTTTPAPGGDPMQSAPMDQTAPPTTDGTAPMTPDAPAADPYTSAPAPTAAPNTTGPITFAPPATNPPPAAQQDYPVCSKTVKDGCRNPGGK